MHNVLFVQYVFLPTEQSETYFKNSIFTYDLTYICPGLFDWNFIPFIDGFPQIMDQNTDHVSRTKSIAAQSASEFFTPRFSTIYMKNGSYRLIPFLFPLVNCICTNFLLEHDKWLSNITLRCDPHCWQYTCGPWFSCPLLQLQARSHHKDDCHRILVFI